MDRPEVAKNDWIVLRAFAEDPGMEARVFRVEDDGSVFVGYWEYSIRSAKGYADWNGEFWHIIDRPVIGMQSKKDELLKRQKSS
jgi:uncharacterized membrane protein